VRLGPSTPGDYVRARVLVPRNPGVTLRASNGLSAMTTGTVSTSFQLTIVEVSVRSSEDPSTFPSAAAAGQEHQ
jgi:hypothetical protein